MVIKCKREYSKPSGEYNYIIFLISYDSDFTHIDNIDEKKSNDEVSDEYLLISCNCTHQY